MTTACVAVAPRPPGHHLVAVRVGVWSTNASAAASNVAVVSRPRTYVPCPSSVWAYVPTRSKARALGSHSACCSASACGGGGGGGGGRTADERRRATTCSPAASPPRLRHEGGDEHAQVELKAGGEVDQLARKEGVVVRERAGPRGVEHPERRFQPRHVFFLPRQERAVCFGAPRLGGEPVGELGPGVKGGRGGVGVASVPPPLLPPSPPLPLPLTCA